MAWLLQFLWSLLARLAALFGAGAPKPVPRGGGPKFYDWPTAPFDKPHNILSTFGEFRGDEIDLIKLHSGTDLPEIGANVELFSPDVGVVYRDGHDPANPSKAGLGAIRIGHFGFNHASKVYPKVDEYYGQVYFPPKLPIHVVEDPPVVFVPTVKSPDVTKDADFKKKTLKKGEVAVAYLKIGAKYENVSIWSRARAIAGNVGPTDLHVNYYNTASGEYRDTDLGNALEVFRGYTNDVEPIADKLWLYTHATDEVRLTFNKVNNTTTLLAGDKGAKLKVQAYSPFASTCGLYQIDYEILCGDPPKTKGRRKVWRFHTAPPADDCFILEDKKLGTWNNVSSPKFTVYVLTCSNNGVINKDNHWELEDTTKWPDCRYTINVWPMNIKEAKGEGQDPTPNDPLYSAECEIKTISQSPLKRSITVTKIFEAKPKPKPKSP